MASLSDARSGRVSRILRLTRAILLVALLVSSSHQQARAVSNTVVISQLYTGGGEPGAAYQNDYVVLFNNGNAPVDLSGWSLQVSTFGPTGPTWETIPLCGSIPHGRFYLVALGSSGGDGASLPWPECVDGTNLDGATGAVALANGSAPLPAPCPSPTDPSVVDLLGYGSAAPCFEGSPAIGLHPGIALSRPSANPCMDTDSNGADFAAIAPSPLTGLDSHGCNNSVPTVDPIPDQTVSEGEVLSFTATASDPDLDPITFGGTGPSWFTVGPTTGLCTFAPGYDAAGLGGATFAATVTATDGIGTGTEGFTITVVNVTTRANTPFAARTGHGVNVPTRELSFAEEPDLCLGGPMSPCFGRNYASLFEREGKVQGSLGRNWSGTYDWGFQILGDEAQVVSPSGREFRFLRTAPGVWGLVSPLDLPYQLVESGLEFRFYDPGTTLIQLFAFLTEADGYRLDRTEDRNGNQLTMTYTGDRLTRVSDGLGRFLEVSRDALGRVISVGDGTRTVSYNYTGDDLTSVINAAGHTTTYTYDTTVPVAGLLTTKVDPAGAAPIRYEYDNLGRVVRVVDASTAQWQYIVLDASESQVLDPTGGLWAFRHDLERRYLVTLIDPPGGTTNLTYDSQGRLTSFTRPSGIQVLGITYDTASGYVDGYTLADGGQVRYTYTSRMIGGIRFDFPSAVEAPDLTQVQYGYDLLGNRTQVTDEAGFSWTLAYNSVGQPTQLVNPAGGVRNLTYDGLGRPASYDDGAGTTTYTYDGLDRLITLTHPDASTRGFTWDARNRLLSLTNEMGKTWTREYRPNGQLLRSRDPLLAETSYAYDGMNRLIEVTDALGGTRSLAYDPAWRVASILDPTSRGVSFQYDMLGRVVARREEPTGQQTSYAYDADGRLLSTTDPMSHSDGFSYDSRDRMIAYTDPLGNVTHYGYDAMGRLTAINAPEGLTSAYTYDARGLLTSASVGPVQVEYVHNSIRALESVNDGNNQNWSFGHDAIGRVTSFTDPLLRTVSYAYDPRHHLVGMTSGEGTASFTHDAAGRLTQRSFSGGTLHTYTYDDIGRLLATEGRTRSYDALGRVTSENGIAYTYDAAGRLLTETLAPGKVVTHSYDARGLLSQVQDWLGGTSTFTHDDDGLPIQMDRPNGTTVIRGYDASHRLQRGRHTRSSELLASFDLTRDALGRVTAADRSMPLPWAPDTAMRSYSFDAASQIVGFTYDGLGRLVGDGARTYDWDLASRLQSFSEGPLTASYVYDGLDRVTQATPLEGASVQLVRGSEFPVSVDLRLQIDPPTKRLSFGGSDAGNSDVLNPIILNPVTLDTDILNPIIVNPTVVTPIIVSPIVVSPIVGDPTGENPSTSSPDVLNRIIIDTIVLQPPSPPTDVSRYTNLPVLRDPHPRDAGDRRIDRLHVVRGTGSPGTDLSYMIRAPGGELLYSLEMVGGSLVPCYFHYDEQGNTAFLTNAGGSIVTSFAYSQSGEPTMLGASPGYPAFTFGGANGSVQEASSGLYRIGSGIYDAPTGRPVAGLGIASGWADMYEPSTGGQWLDIAVGPPPGGVKGGGGGTGGSSYGPPRIFILLPSTGSPGPASVGIGPDRQGIQAGWGDLYKGATDLQWLDLSTGPAIGENILISGHFKVDDIGSRFSGKYYITSTSHKAPTGGGYTTVIRVRRPAEKP